MKLKPAVAGLYSLLLILSCSKQAGAPLPLPGNGDKPLPVLTKIAKDDYRFATFSYDAGNKLVEINDATWMDNKSRCIYDAFNRLSAIAYHDARFDLVYAGNRITRINFVNTHLEPEQVTGYTDITYTGEKITQLISYPIDETTPLPFEKTTFEYYSNGDLQSRKDWTYNQETCRLELQYRRDFEYDNQNNPAFSFMKDTPWRFTVSDDLHVFSPSPHNITRLMYYEGERLMSTVNISYTYSPQGYPVIRQEHAHYENPLDPDEDYSILYEYKNQ